MPKVKVKRSLQINAPISDVFNKLNDLRHWTAWSPWFIIDQDAKVNVTEEGKYYEWEGNRVGSGNMRVTSEEENKSIDLHLQFLNPWKSKADVRLETEEKEGGTQVTWHMNTGLPFFMFWMKKMMEGFIAMDYDRGLRLLKDYVEDGEVHSKLNFIGNETIEAKQFIGIKTSCGFDQMGKKMSEDMPKLFAFIKENRLEQSGPAFTQYHKWDFKSEQAIYVTGIPLAHLPEGDLGEFHSGTIPSTSVYTLEHVGRYAHLSNAWTALYTMQRGKEFKVNKKIHPFETYHNYPVEVSENELVTRIHFPLS